MEATFKHHRTATPSCIDIAAASNTAGMLGGACRVIAAGSTPDKELVDLLQHENFDIVVDLNGHSGIIGKLALILLTEYCIITSVNVFTDM